MQIIDLQYRKRRAGSEVTVLLDDESCIPLDAEVVVRFHLAKGMDVSPELIAEIKLDDELLRAKRMLVQYLSLRKKSTADAVVYLKKAGFSKQVSDLVIRYAQERNYLDDADFTAAFIRTRMKAGTKGPRVLTNELQARGIGRDEARKAVEKMAEPETQMEMARRVAAKKYPSLKDSDDLGKASRKLNQHLARRGFDPDICDRITREFFGEPTQF